MISRRRFLSTTTCAAVVSDAAMPGTSNAVETQEPLFSIGLIADAQYADVAPGGIRHYRKSVKKLTDAVSAINEADVDFSIHLGDLIDRDFENFDAILEPLGQLKQPMHQILGNHDFSVTEDKKPLVAKKMGIASPYYAFSKQGIRFVFLDGTEISTFAQPKGTEIFEQATEILAEFKAKGRKNARPWNAAIGAEQVKWFQSQLTEAAKAGEKAIVSCHYPILPDNGHNLWNDEEILSVIDQHADTVIAWFNGHNHAGNYAVRNGVHYITVHGMVDTPDTNAYAVLDVLPDALRIRGSGREPDRLLNFR